MPQLTIAAWYDIFQDGSLRNYIGVKAHGATDAARRGQHLLVDRRRSCGGRTENRRRRLRARLAASTMRRPRWRGTTTCSRTSKNEFAGKPVKIFVMGANQWREEDDWPLARAQATKYFLHSAGKANSLRGNGTLSTAAPGATEARRSVHLRSGESRADDRRSALLRRRAPAAGPARSASGRSARRCAGVLDAAAGVRTWKSPAGEPGAVRQVVSGGHRLHGQARGRLAERLRAEPDRGHPAHAISRLAGEA